MTVYNFSPGPAILPNLVKNKLKEAITNYENSGIGIAELSHRSEIFIKLASETEDKILNICELKREEYKVLFLQGGASQQFAMMPMNFLTKDKKAAFISSGVWADKAYENALYYGNAEVIAKSEDFKSIPSFDDRNLSEYEYLHLTSNNTIYGTALSELPKVDIPVFCDASSDFLSRKMDFSNVSLLYACAQKNLGIAGVTIVLIKKSLLTKTNNVPDIFSYKVHADKDSCFNTPTTIGVLAASLSLDWINQSGGLKVIEAENIKKADCIYSVLDSNKCFLPFADKISRSRMNITFNVINKELENKLSELAKANNFLFIDGHRSVGGFRISIYNAQSYDACKAVANFLSDFAEKYST
jgi:phosphoserine aminotransferase